MGTATTEASQRSEAPVEAVGELLYRFEADLDVTPVGLTPEGIRMTVDYDGRITTGMLEGPGSGGPIPC